MRVFVSRTTGGIDSLRLEDRPAPGPLGSGQVRIAMRAASLNYRDLLVLSGGVRSALTDGLIPCSDGAGEVVEAAPDVWRVKVGDRAALTFNPDWIAGPWRPSPGAAGRGGAIPGVMCDELVVSQHEAVRLPAHLTFEDGAALPCAAVTAWRSLCGAGPLLPGMTVLLQGGGGVSVFALQFAKLFGARVIMTSSNPERCARLAGLGADETVDYTAHPEWSKVVRELTSGEGVDLTIEVGGAKTVEQSLAATRMGGRVTLVGLLTGLPQSSGVFAAGVEVGSAKVGSREDLEALIRAMAFHGVRPVIDSRFSFEALPEGLRALQQGRHLGKIVVNFDAGAQ